MYLAFIHIGNFHWLPKKRENFVEIVSWFWFYWRFFPDSRRHKRQRAGLFCSSLCECYPLVDHLSNSEWWSVLVSRYLYMVSYACDAAKGALANRRTRKKEMKWDCFMPTYLVFVSIEHADLLNETATRSAC